MTPPTTLPHATPAKVVERATMMWDMTVPSRHPTTTGLRPMMSDMLPVITQPGQGETTPLGQEGRGGDRERAGGGETECHRERGRTEV